jgi:hypothetical protein
VVVNRLQQRGADLVGKGFQIDPLPLLLVDGGGFTRAFRRATGMTPAEYRRTLQ